MLQTLAMQLILKFYLRKVYMYYVLYLPENSGICVILKTNIITHIETFYIPLH